MRRIVAAALVIVPLALARADDDRAPAGEAAPSATAPKKADPAERKPPDPGKAAAKRKEAPDPGKAAPPKEGEAKKAEPLPCEEVKPCPID